MKRITSALIIIASCLSCTDLFLGDDPKNNSVAIFDEFWKGVDNTWPSFEGKHVNWDSLYLVYRPQVNSTSSNEDLIKVLTGLLYNLKDTHTTIYPKNLPAILFYPDHPMNFYGITWIVNAYSIYYKGNKTITYGLLNPNVGYIYIPSFQHESSDYILIDNILLYFKEAKGIIIDVRSNSGGNSINGATIASRFANKANVYEYTKHRIDANGTALSDFASATISPDGPFQFSKKVAVLTNGYSYSATEDFVLMMRSFPQVIQLGDATGGGSETAPIFKELPLGWYCRVGSLLLCDVNKQPISKGIRPDIYVQTAKADSLKGKDSIIERAVEELMK